MNRGFRDPRFRVPDRRRARYRERSWRSVSWFGVLLLVAISALVLAACAAEDAGGDSTASMGGWGDGDEQPEPGGAGSGHGRDAATAADAGSMADTALPPEEEEAFDLQAPRASQTYVFVANTTLNTVVRIDSLTLSVKPIEVCLEPTIVRTLPTMDRAVALCRGDDQIAIVDAEGGDDAVRFSWVAENSNSMVLSPTGAYALAWFDEDAVETIADDPGNPHDLTLIALGEDDEQPVSYLLSVGFGIRTIAFDNEGTRAFVTTEDGLNIVDMDEIDGDQFVPVRSLGDDPLALAVDREVLVTGTGDFAFVRTSDFSGLRVLDIADDELTDLVLPAVPTDLDLFSDGAHGIAVLREIGSVAVIPLPEAVDNPDAIEYLEISDEVIGLAQLHEASNEVVLYSTVTESDHVTVLNLDSGGYDTYALRKPVTGVQLAPADARAIVFHSAGAGVPVPGEAVGDFIDKSFGYTLFDLTSGAARLVLSPAEPDDVVVTEEGDQAFVMLDDRATDVRSVQWVNFNTFRSDDIELARPPESIGVVPATGRVFVSQLADTGRITFIDTDTGRQQHVTAYQLNRRIE